MGIQSSAVSGGTALFRRAAGLGKISGFEIFVTVWFVSAPWSDGQRRYRGKIARRVPANW